MNNFLKKKLLAITFSIAACFVGGVNAEVVRIETYSLVCQKALSTLDRNVNSFQKDFGQPKSKQEHKYKLEYPNDGADNYAIATTITYTNDVTLIYETINRSAVIRLLTLDSVKSANKIGFNVKTAAEIKKLYGTPDQETSNSLTYGCDSVDVTFTTKDGLIVGVRISAPAI
jgi:hypothetical protein